MQKRILKFYEWEAVNESVTNYSEISSGNYDQFLGELGGTASNNQPLVYTDADENRIPKLPPNPAKFVGIPEKPEEQFKSGFYTPGGTDDDWGGSAIRALVLAKAAIEKSGVPAGSASIGSQKRDSRLVAGSSKDSDHHYENPDSYAVDIPVKNTLVGDKVFKALIDYFGSEASGFSGKAYTHFGKFGKDKRLKKKSGGGNDFEAVADNYRYQFLWKVPNHYDHIHIGVKNMRGGTSTDAGQNFSDDDKWYERKPEDLIAPPKGGDYLVTQLERGFNPKDDPELFKQFKGYLQRLKKKGD